MVCVPAGPRYLRRPAWPVVARAGSFQPDCFGAGCVVLPDAFAAPRGKPITGGLVFVSLTGFGKAGAGRLPFDWSGLGMPTTGVFVLADEPEMTPGTPTAGVAALPFGALAQVMHVHC
jgi:hypothetical protein